MKNERQCIWLQANPVPCCHTCGYGSYYADEYHVTRKIDTFVLIFMLKNVLYFTEDGAERVVQPGEVYLQCPNILQSSTQASPGAHYFWIHFSAESKSTNQEINRQPNRMEVSRIPNYLFQFPIRATFEPQRLLPLFDELYAYRYRPENNFRYQSIFTRILDKTCVEEMEDQQINNGLANKIRHYIDMRFMEDLSSERFTMEFHYTYDYLRRVFFRKYNVTPFQYLATVRNLAACDMIENTNKSLTSIAYEIGYKTELNFYKTFRKEYGLSPSAYRKEKQQNMV